MKNTIRNSSPLSMKRSIVYRCLLFSSLFLLVEWFCNQQTGGFHLSKVSSASPRAFNPSPEPPPPELNQSFTFLAGGVQCYALIGEDKKTVLKVFKERRGKVPTVFFQNRLGRPVAKKRSKRVASLFESAWIARHTLPAETGVFYAHLSKTGGDLGKGHFIDKLGITHTVDLDDTAFILQKRATLAKERLEELFSKGAVEEAIESMRSLLTLVETRMQKGIKNKDGNILENCGFIENIPLELDISAYCENSPSDQKKVRNKVAIALLRFVKNHYPEHLETCKQELLYEEIL